MDYLKDGMDYFLDKMDFNRSLKNHFLNKKSIQSAIEQSTQSPKDSYLKFFLGSDYTHDDEFATYRLFERSVVGNESIKHIFGETGLSSDFPRNFFEFFKKDAKIPLKDQFFK